MFMEIGICTPMIGKKYKEVAEERDKYEEYIYKFILYEKRSLSKY